jgi:prepilin-type N-terminal cleavage/methylation domain-containing protein
MSELTDIKIEDRGSKIEDRRADMLRSSILDPRYSIPVPRRGFTLIEMATVVVILAILTAIALPSMAQSDELTASAAARQVLSDLLYAQSQAIATQNKQFVSFSLTGSGGYTVYSSPTTIMTNPTTQAPYTITMGTGPMADVALSGVTLDTATNVVLAFDEVGCPYACQSTTATPVALANTGTISLTCGTATIVLSIEPDTGNITVSQ